MEKIVIDSYCGLSRDNCTYRETSNCGNCIAARSNPNYSATAEQCKIAACVKAKQAEGNGLTFCGECADFPCETLKAYSNDPEHGDKPAGARIQRCIELKNAKTAAARAKLSTARAICGFNCDRCFLGQWCGGCRSDYNCCSFATLFKDKKCPNVACAEKRGLADPKSGCYSCPDLKDCTVGFYDGKHGGSAKAAALMIAKYGEKGSGDAFKRLVDAGFEKALDETITAEEAMAMLEKYVE